MSAERNMTGQVVVITGAAGGIGRALAARFGRAGARLGLLDIDAAGLEVARAELVAAGCEAVVAPCDVTSPESCVEAMESVQRALGDIGVLINNAGAVHRSGFVDTDIAVYRRVMEVNFFGALHCTKAALPSLLRSRGLIIVTSSIAGLAPLYGRTGYAASKHALHGLFESARAELAPDGVEVLMVCPSFTASGFERAALGADGKPAGTERSLVGKLATPDSVADAVFRGAVARRRLIVLSGAGKAAYLLSRLAPAFYERMMVRSLRGADGAAVTEGGVR
jgi:NAD(P)-dependent dehydrogenase (short-subunit alcohol dehydrogenase family)